MKPRPVPPPPPTLIGLLLGIGGLAVLSGLALLIANGRWLGLSPSLLEPSPFSSFRGPGLLLAAIVGGSQLTAGFAVLRRQPGYRRLAVIAAAILGGWIAIQALLIGVFWLQPVVFVAAIVEVGLVASSLPSAKPAPAPRRKRH